MSRKAEGLELRAESQPLDAQLADLLGAGGAPYDKAWIDRATALIVAAKEFRLAAHRMHRRAQQAERQALREGKRADALAGKLRRMLTREAARENC